MSLLQIYEPGETPHPHHDGAAVGIDLGTTHSVVAIARGGVATVLHDVCGGVLVPSIVYYGDKGDIIVGKNARRKLQEGDMRAIASIKRYMGHGSKQLTIGDRQLTPVAISADILRHIKELAERAIGVGVAQAVITVPAYFDDSARQATKDAAKLAGLEVLRLINEPTAAALAYGLEHAAEGIYAIYDLGGGTFDISLLKLEKGVFQVLATGGDVALGGDDVDRAIADAFIAHHALAPSASAQAIVIERARAVKETLSNAESAILEFEGKSLTVSRADLETWVRPALKRTLSICEQALADAQLSTSQVHGVVLVGGSTRMPLVRQYVEQFFGQPPLANINPDEVVAVGAAIQAEALTQGGDTLLLDVVPLSLGLETMGGIVEKIIYRNTPIPVAVSQEFTTYQDGQNGMVIHVVQGEREMVEQNRSLARFELSGIPALPAGIARVKVTFIVDADGLLSVQAREETTGTEQSVIVKPSYGLAEGDIERMLLESMEHAKTDILERLLREAIIEAKRSLEEVHSAFTSDASLLESGERAAIERQMQVLEASLVSGDRDFIDAEREKLHHETRAFAERRMDRAIRSALKDTHIDHVASS